jgi:WD40 repeat protein
VSACIDGTVGIWDVPNGRRLHTVSGATKVAVSADGQYLLTGEAGGAVRLWELTWDYAHPPERPAPHRR